MKRLFLVRHGKAEPKEAGREDFSRPLAEEGRRQAQALGRKLRSHGAVPDLVLSSAAPRARETATLIIAELSRPVQAHELDELYGADAAGYLRLLRGEATGASVMVVGHNPAVEGLASLLAGYPVELKTCWAAEVELSDWAELRGGAHRIVVITPREEP